jgi:multidrug efflux system membrane fusion protein
MENEKRRRSRWIFAALGLVAVALLLWVIFHKPPAKPAPPKSVPVTVVKVAVRDIDLTLSNLGAAQAWRSDTIFSQVTGKLLSVNFTEGSDVRAGQVLAQVDPAPYRAALMQAQGALMRDQALLADARLDLVRYQKLQKQDSISGQQVDTQAALVRQDEGTVLLDQGAVAAAKVNLDWCRVVSPISGRAGVRLVDPGNLVSASGSVASNPATTASTSNGSTSTTASSGTGIVVINQIEPIAVTFTLPEGEFQRVSQMSDGFTKPLPVQALSQESGQVLDTGEVGIVDNRVDATTGTFELKARFPNSGRKLWPGQFVNVQLRLQTLKGVIAIPLAAENQGPKGPFAFVVGAGSKVSVRPITVDHTQGDTVVIKSGLQAGELVVIDGQQTLKAGSLVKIAQPAAPGAKPAAS